MNRLARRPAVMVFLAFAFTYFFSALLRAVTATLAPTLTQEFELNARDLGLLGGGYFLGFAAMQLPLGYWLDRYGPRRVVLSFLGAAVIGCLAFSAATGFPGLFAARVLCGIGVSACLMAPLTGFRTWFQPSAQLRANSWMLMTGSFGMLASTLPVQWLMPLVGWRPLFWGLAGCILMSMALIAWKVPQSELMSAPGPVLASGYGSVWRNAYFRRMVPIGFFSYGGMIAIQTLWAGPWLVKVTGYAPLQAAQGLFWINASMLCSFWCWGLLNPLLVRRGLTADRLITWGLPSSLVALAYVVVAKDAGGAAALAWFCVSSTFVALAQPAVGMAFSPTLAGRALSAYNLVIFSGVFAVQWGIGLLIDGFVAIGIEPTAAHQSALSALLLCNVISYAWFLLARRDNQVQTVLEP